MSDTPVQEERPLRFCDVCSQLDDHPRHVVGLPPDHPDGAVSQQFLGELANGAPVEAIARLLNVRVRERHHDCCAAAGCEVCQATEAIHGGKRGEDLIASVLAGVGRDLDTTNMSLGLSTDG